MTRFNREILLQYYDSVVDVIKRIFSVAHSDVADAGAIYCPRDTPQRVIFTELFLRWPVYATCYNGRMAYSTPIQGQNYPLVH